MDVYAFQSMDFHGDADLTLPPRAQWGDIGMFLCFMLLNIYIFSEGYVIFLCGG